MDRVALPRLLTLFDDNDLEVILIILLYWRQITSPLHNWLLRKRITLQRIIEERRIGIHAFIHEVLPRYPNIQFEEHFRMARATFEVTSTLKRLFPSNMLEVSKCS